MVKYTKTLTSIKKTIKRLNLHATILVHNVQKIILISARPAGVQFKLLDLQIRKFSCSQERNKHAKSSVMISIPLMVKMVKRRLLIQMQGSIMSTTRKVISSAKSAISIAKLVLARPTRA